jgi:hypothetical protein
MFSFQHLFEEADKICGIHGKSMPIPQEDTSQLVALYQQLQKEGKLKPVYQVNDLEKLLSMVQKIALPPKSSFSNENPILGTYTKQITFPKTLKEDISKLFAENPSLKQPYYEWENEVRESMKNDSDDEDDGIGMNERKKQVEYDSEEERERERKRKQSSSFSSSAGLKGGKKVSFQPNPRSHSQLHQQQQPLFPHFNTKIHTLADDIIPYRCFDTDYVDIHEDDDPLDRIFPNQFSSSLDDNFLVMDDEADDEERQEFEEEGKYTNRRESVRKEEFKKKPPKQPSIREKLFSRFTKGDLILSDGNSNVASTSASAPVAVISGGDTGASTDGEGDNAGAFPISLSQQSSSSSTAAAAPAAPSTSSSSHLSPDEEVRRMRLYKEKQRLQEKIQRIKGIDTWLDASTTLVKSTTKRTRDISLHSRMKTMIQPFNHTAIALNHRNTRADLKEIELKYFHRPRILKERDRSWQIVLRQKTNRSGQPGSSSKVGMEGGVGGGGSHIMVVEEDKQNLSLLSLNTKFILIEYIEEFPPLMLNYGMASYIINYFRSTTDSAQEIIGGEGSSLLEGNTTGSSLLSSSTSNGGQPPKKQARTVSSLNNSNTSSEFSKIEKIKKQLASTNTYLPRHIMLLWELNNMKRSYEHDANIPKQKIGSTKVLSPDDLSPFLGNIEEGELQTSFENNLFRSPLFHHTPSSTDFLLIRTKVTSSICTFHLRSLPAGSLFLSGQMEPQVIVPRPVFKVTLIQEKFFLLAISRLLSSHPNGLAYQEIVDAILKYCGKDKLSPHKYYYRKHFKELIRRIAEEVKETLTTAGINTTLYRWFLRETSSHHQSSSSSSGSSSSSFFSGNFGGSSLNNSNQQNDDEELAQLQPDNLVKSFSPEDVCIQESCNAAEYRLIQSNVTGS